MIAFLFNMLSILKWYTYNNSNNALEILHSHNISNEYLVIFYY